MLMGHRRHERGVAARGGQRGLSLVEMMVGIAIGLFVLLAALCGYAARTTDESSALAKS